MSPRHGVWADPRVQAGPPPAAVLASARAVVEVLRPVAVRRLPWAPWPADLTGTLAAPASALDEGEASGVRVAGTRHTGRRLLHGDQLPPAWLPVDHVEPLDRDVLVERWRQRES